EAVDAARLLFTPDLLTPRMLAEIRSQKRLRDTLRQLDIRQLIQSCHYSEHVLTVEQLESVVADNAVALATALAGQLFPPPSGFPVLDLMVSRLAPDTLSAQGFAVVLDDPIGITQELNAWRNAAAGALDAFMQDTDSEGISNQRKHTIAFALDNLKTTLAEQAEQGYTAHANTLGVRYTDHEYALGNAHMLSASSGRYRSYRNPHDQQQQEQRDIAQARSKSWDDNYADSIDEPRRQAFLAHYQAAVDRADALNNQRAADHLRWLNSAALEDAFACYDRHDSRNGLAFEAQLGVAVSGINSTPAGDAQLDRWSEADSVSPGNWYWRGLAQNQARALEPINQLLAQRAQLPSLDGDALLALVKPLVEVYDKSHALVGELDFSTPPSNLRLSGAVLLTHTFGTQLLRSGPARLLDGPVNTALALVFRARLGTLGAQLHLETHHAPLTAGGKARMARAAQQSFGNALTAGAAGPMLEVRLGTTLAILEVMNLMRRAQKHDKGTREYIELMAAIVAVSAAGLELGAVAVG
uniref:T6SS effector BTH_I2691 family protein n=1 Tax=Pseudomonas sp. Irchel s3h17 TaxID=2009182 RepID=UPI00155EB605